MAFEFIQIPGDATFRRIALPALLLAGAAVAQAGPRGSANYTIPTDTTDAGGRRATSASYTNDGSAGGITGISSVAAPAQTAKAGYIGQLGEVTALQLAATPATVNETATRQLSAGQLLDDLTTNAVQENFLLAGHVIRIAGAVEGDPAVDAEEEIVGWEPEVVTNADNF